MRVISPSTTIAVLLVSSSQSSPVAAKCFFGTFNCGDGESICLNPITAAKCAFDAVFPIKLDEVVKSLGESLKVLTPDEVDFVINLGVSEVNDVFTDFRDCFKVFEGTVPKCQELHTVHACVSTALSVAGNLKAAGKFAKLEDKLSKADSALDIIESKVIPALNAQCGSGCANEDACPAPTTTTTTTTTECDDSSSATTDTTASTAVTLEYHEPAGCTCLDMTVTAYDWGSAANTTAQCARNMAFFMEDQDPPLLSTKTYFPEMGCFVGKQTDNGCTGATPLEEGDVDLGDARWDLNDLQFLYFIPCTDQFGRKYSERSQHVALPPVATAATKSCTNTTTTTTTSDSSADSSAITLQGLTNAMISVYVVLATAATWWIVG